MKNRILLLIIVLYACSCSVSNIKFEAIKPAQINIPTNIESLIIANRTTPTKNNKAENILDGILSGEQISRLNLRARTP